MPTIAEIPQAILALPESDYLELCNRLAELNWDRWDQEIEADSRAGKLDFLTTEALEAKQSGTLQDL